MKYWKNVQFGAVVAADAKPTTVGLWREATEREYNEELARTSRLMENLEKAVAYKARLLKA